MNSFNPKKKKRPKFRLLLNNTSVGIIVTFVLLFIPFWVYYKEIKDLSHHVVEHYGYPALFVMTWLADTVIQPIPADIFVFGSTFGGATMTLTAVIAGLASSLGGFSGYYIGRAIGARRFARYFGRELLRTGRNLFTKYGAVAVFISGVSPIPYSAVCYMGGIFHMSVWRLFLASIASRTIRYLFFGWLGYLA